MFCNFLKFQNNWRIFFLSPKSWIIYLAITTQWSCNKPLMELNLLLAQNHCPPRSRVIVLYTEKVCSGDSGVKIFWLNTRPCARKHYKQTSSIRPSQKTFWHKSEAYTARKKSTCSHCSAIRSTTLDSFVLNYSLYLYVFSALHFFPLRSMRMPH